MIHDINPEAERAGNALAFWRGEGGVAYTARNPATPERMRALHNLWSDILSRFSGIVESAVEVGAGAGDNLAAMRAFIPGALHGVEPNPIARSLLAEIAAAHDGCATDTRLPGGLADLAFTSACLIHVPPWDLAAALREIHRVARRYIVAVEYFSHEPEEVVWRGRSGLVWKRDFGAAWLDVFPDLKPVGCGFAWKRMTGLDDLTWWAFEKPAAR